MPDEHAPAVPDESRARAAAPAVSGPAVADAAVSGPVVSGEAGPEAVSAPAPDASTPAPDAGALSAAASGGDIPPPPGDPELRNLRALILKREIALIDQLRRRLDDPRLRAKEASGVIAEALLLRAARDEKLKSALGPVVEDIFKNAVRSRPQEFVQAVFPLMGPAVRRSIGESIRAMLQGFNKSMEMAFSWQGLRWRLEGWRTGKPFSEVVLLHTLVYRVEQLFLIHSGTGLVLAHVTGEGVESEDADLVSAMLTAIQDFVRDSFLRDKPGGLESMQTGDFTVLVEQGSAAHLACVLRGTPPLDFPQRLRETLELVEIEFADALARFDGDSAPFGPVRYRLQSCMAERFADEGKPLPLRAKLVPALLLLALLAGAGFWGWRNHVAAEAAFAREARLNACAEAVGREPGLVLVEKSRDAEGRLALRFLKDDLARDPAGVIAEAGGEADDFSITSEPFISLEPAIVALRVRREISPPEGVDMRLDAEGVLRLSGEAPIDWILHARQNAKLLPGVHGVDFSDIVDPRMAQVEILQRRVEAARIRFGLDKATPVPEDEGLLEDTVNALVELEKLARGMGLAAEVTVYGHADASGSARRNYELSQQRARTLAAMLYSKGSTLPVTMYGMGADYAAGKEGAPVPAASESGAAKDASLDRRIELRVRLIRAGGTLLP